MIGPLHQDYCNNLLILTCKDIWLPSPLYMCEDESKSHLIEHCLKKMDQCRPVGPMGPEMGGCFVNGMAHHPWLVALHDAFETDLDPQPTKWLPAAEALPSETLGRNFKNRDLDFWVSNKLGANIFVGTWK